MHAEAEDNNNYTRKKGRERLLEWQRGIQVLKEDGKMMILQSNCILESAAVDVQLNSDDVLLSVTITIQISNSILTSARCVCQVNSHDHMGHTVLLYKVTKRRQKRCHIIYLV